MVPFKVRALTLYSIVKNIQDGVVIDLIPLPSFILSAISYTWGYSAKGRLIEADLSGGGQEFKPDGNPIEPNIAKLCKYLPPYRSGGTDTRTLRVSDNYGQTVVAALSFQLPTLPKFSPVSDDVNFYYLKNEGKIHLSAKLKNALQGSYSILGLKAVLHGCQTSGDTLELYGRYYEDDVEEDGTMNFNFNKTLTLSVFQAYRCTPGGARVDLRLQDDHRNYSPVLQTMLRVEPNSKR